MTSLARNRVEVMHGVNLDQLGRRDPLHYGTMKYEELERFITELAGQIGLATRFFQTNHEGEFVERLHALQGQADAVLLNPGAWTDEGVGPHTSPAPPHEFLPPRELPASVEMTNLIPPNRVLARETPCEG